MADTQQQKAEPLPWWAAFPAPKAECPAIEAAELVRLLDSDHQANGVHDEATDSNRDFLLVDVRRNDWEGGTIASSMNLPAQTLYQTRGVVYDLCKRAGIKRIIFYCGSCSHGGRGWKCANWMQDYIDERGDQDIQALRLTGGIKAWVAKFGAKHMEWYEATYWEQFK